MRLLLFKFLIFIVSWSFLLRSESFPSEIFAQLQMKVYRSKSKSEAYYKVIIIQPVNHKNTYKLSSFISSESSVKLLITSVIWPCKPVYFLPTTWRLNRVFYSFPSCSCSSLSCFSTIVHLAPFSLLLLFILLAEALQNR